DALPIGQALPMARDPDPRCPFCVALAALPWPAEGTERLCAPHLTRWRQLQCRGWNADPQHQVMAGQARARQFTPASQQQAGFASWDAFSARWRAAGGLAPLSADAVRKYVTPDLIRGVCGLSLAPELQADIYRAWCAGQLAHVVAWLAGEAPPDPDGLWAGDDAGADAGVIGS
ncbi:MAG TPA: hypothetical protein VFP52_00065, partial [Myxococcales bacterium]|nr:hypothetical protein [Myxococcales bacterium]